MRLRDSDKLMGTAMAAEVREAVREVAKTYGAPTERVGAVVERLVQGAMDALFFPSPRLVIAEAFHEELAKEQEAAREKLTGSARREVLRKVS